MSRTVLVVRPEPGNTATCAALRAAGLTPVAHPLFQMAPMAWQAPPADQFDALLLTSAHAVRLSGPRLMRYAGLRLACVGDATAAAALAAGLAPAIVGDARGAQALLDTTRPATRWLWLCGADHRTLTAAPPSTLTAIVSYRAERHAMPPQAPATDAIILLHSPAAAQALQSWSWPRGGHHIVAGSTAIAVAAGTGWQAISVAASPLDRDMVEYAVKLWQI